MKPTLLIVDDEEAQMRVLCDALSREGFETAGFTSPHDALSAFRENHTTFY